MRQFFGVLVFGAFVGGVLGWVGVSIDHYNESTFGGSYSQYRWDFAALPALPGMILVNWRLGYDWRIDEMWSFKWEIVWANALFWGLLTAIICLPLINLRRKASSATILK